MNPRFLDFDDILEIYEDQIRRYGGSFGVRDEGLLKSAIAQPRGGGFGIKFFHQDFAAMAAAYLFHIVQNHPFADGNKRTGLAVALNFLDMNGQIIGADFTEALHDATLAVADQRMSKKELTELFRQLLAKS